MERLNSVNEDPRFQVYMSREEDDRKIMNSIKHEYYDKGIEQGREEEKIRNAKSFMNNGVSLEIISQSLDIPIEELKKMNN